jgi:hypothetical protein
VVLREGKRGTAAQRVEDKSIGGALHPLSERLSLGCVGSILADAVVKMEESSPEVVVVHPTKTIVTERKETDTELLQDSEGHSNDDDEVELDTRGDDSDERRIKRESDDEIRDRAAPSSDDRDSPLRQQSYKKEVPSSPGVGRTRNTSGHHNNAANGKNHSSQQRQHQSQNLSNARYYNNNPMPPNGGGGGAMPPGPRGGLPFPMARGYGGPPTYGGGNGGGGYHPHPSNYGPPPPPMHYHPSHHHHHLHHPPPPLHHHHHRPPHMMPPYGNGPPGGPYPGGPSGAMNGSYIPSMSYGGSGQYGVSSFPSHHGINPNYPINANNSGSSSSMHVPQSDSNSISSKSSMNSKKKRTIDGLQQHHHHHQNPHNNKPSSYSFRRSDSNSSATSTATAGNNTSTETQQTNDSLHHSSQQQHQHSKQQHTSGCESGLSSLRVSNNNPRSTTIRPGVTKPHFHRRDYSGASTASSLSVGGFSLSSYERGTCLRVRMKSSFVTRIVLTFLRIPLAFPSYQFGRYHDDRRYAQKLSEET